MIIPQPVLDAFTAIQASNPIPDITTLTIGQTTLDSTQAELQGWLQVLELVRQQHENAIGNVNTLQAQVKALQGLLGVGSS